MVIDEEDLIEGEERVILSTDDAQVVAVHRGIEEPKRSRLEIHSYRELPYTRFTGDEVDELIKDVAGRSGAEVRVAAFERFRLGGAGES